MKRPLISFRLLFFGILPVLALAIAGSGCKKSGGGSSVTGVTATVGTTAFQSTVASGIDYIGSITLTGMQVSNGDTLIMLFNFPDTLTLNKSYVLDGTIVSLSYYDKKSGSTTYTATGQGTDASAFTITSFNKTSKTIGGTFGCKVWPPNGDGIVITNGKFNVTYQ